jgi:murein DD-endopeptidase MepM/ murein hydrolase activator NlpD
MSADSAPRRTVIAVAVLAFSLQGVAAPPALAQPSNDPLAGTVLAVFEGDSLGTTAIAVASKVTLKAEPATVVYGATVTLRATAVRDGTTTALPRRSVRFQQRPVGTSSWTSLGKVQTDSAGRARMTHVPKVNTEYRAVVVADAETLSSTSSRQTVQVRPKLTLVSSHARINLGRAATLTGKVTPAHARSEVVLQARRSDGTWAVVSTHKLDTDSRFSITFRPTKGGTKTVRVKLPKHGDHASGWSPRVSVQVRTYVFPVKPASAATYGRYHHDYPATDIFASCGTEVVAPTAGVVHEVSRVDLWDPAVNAGSTRGGLSVSIIGRDGVRYYGSHFQTIRKGVEPGVKVATGQLLGTVGRTGSARPTPCHLHFGISPPCGAGDWQVRRGVVPTWPYLDAWKAGTQRSPAKEVAAWRATNPKLCP